MTLSLRRSRSHPQHPLLYSFSDRILKNSRNLIAARTFLQF
ncbi:hypothetical protein PN499_12830 [Kamptonema animale CS-326]|nr:hypothetical protein [Kamptonema animale]MDB9512071.1 hypothetical protein [Kamptonema animale CS-326]